MSPSLSPGAGQFALQTAEGEGAYAPPPGYIPPTGPSERERAIARSAAANRPPIPPPPTGEEINAALYNSTRYTGNPKQTHTVPPPLADIDADNRTFANAIIGRWSDGVTLWVAAQLQLASWEVADNIPAIRVRLAQHLARLFAGRGAVHAGIYGQAIQPSSLRGMMRIALQGAQQLTEENSAAEIVAAAGGSGLSTAEPAYRVWKDNWQQHATQWMQERQALDWSITAEIIAGLPLRPREFRLPVVRSAVVADISKWYGSVAPQVGGRYLQSMAYERNPAYRRAGPEQREWPQGFGVEGSSVAPDLIVYAWDGWREELSSSNRVACYALCMQLPPETLQQLAGDAGVIPDLPRKDKIIALAESWATYATETSVSLMMAIARDAELRGLASYRSLRALEDAATAFGAGGFFDDLWSGIKRLAGHVVKWFNAIGREIGRFLQVLGREVMRWARIPIIGDLFVVASGMEFVFGIVLPNVGRMLQTGKSSAFVAAELGYGIARLLDRLGRALAMVTPFLPPPFNLAAGIISAVCIAAGGVVQYLMTVEAQKEAFDAYYADQQTQWEEDMERWKAGADGAAADNPGATDAAANAAYDTSLDYLQREGKLGGAMLDASKDLATRGITGFSKIALAAAGVVALGFAGYLMTRKA